MLLECQRLANPENRGGAKVQAGSRENTMSNYATIRIPGETAGKIRRIAWGVFSRKADSRARNKKEWKAKQFPAYQKSGSRVASMLPECRVASMSPGKLVRVTNINPESRKLPAPSTKPDSPEMSCGHYSGKPKKSGELPGAGSVRFPGKPITARKAEGNRKPVTIHHSKNR